MKKYRAYVKINDIVPTEMIMSGKDKESVRRKLTDFYLKLDKNIKIEIELKEVYFDENNYIEMEDENE